jgi:hypothetical protein
MRRAILLLLLLLPAAAAAAPARAPQAAPALTGTPYLFRGGDETVRLVFRTDVALPRRYDGLIGGGAIIAGHRASLGTVGGVDEQTHCYTAAVRFPARIGRRYHVLIAAQQGEPAPYDLRLALRRARSGDARGRPLGC